METTAHKLLEAKQVMGLLKQRDIQPTQQRVQIARVLFARDQHLSADDVLRMVNQDAARVSKATVYNTLGLFASKGLVREVIVDPSRVFYDPNTRPHHHFYNVDTGALTDIDTRECALTRLPAPPSGTVTDGVDIIIRVRNGG
ncbi:MAG TPA: Fur family transcriptional regulator [Thiohalobacter sp.]|nr:Fur family transcriptional regulator [Thiohalobacter sp.]